MTLHITLSGEFAGYAALFNRKDAGGDIILPGAFARSLKARGVRGIRMLWQHDPGQPLGVWRLIREDARGLFVRGRLALDTRLGRDVAALLKQGAVDGLSIGFLPVRAVRDRARRARLLKEIDLWEISLVTFPMQPAARVMAARGHPGRPWPARRRR